MSENENKMHIPVVPRRPSRNTSVMTANSLKSEKHNSSSRENIGVLQTNSEDDHSAQSVVVCHKVESLSEKPPSQESIQQTATSSTEHNDDHQIIHDDRKQDCEDSQGPCAENLIESTEDLNFDQLPEDAVSVTDTSESQSLKTASSEKPTTDTDKLSEFNFSERPPSVSESEKSDDIDNSKNSTSKILEKQATTDYGMSEILEPSHPVVTERPNIGNTILSKPAIPQRPSHLKMKSNLLNKPSPPKKLLTKPAIPQRPTKTGSFSDENKEKQPPPIVPKKPSSKILAFQTMLAQQQREQSGFTAKPSIGKRAANTVANDASEGTTQNRRAEFAKNLNGIFGGALPGMTPSGFHNKTTVESGSDVEGKEKDFSETTEEDLIIQPKKSSTKRGRAGLKGRRLPSATTKKVDITIPDKKFSKYVADIWEVKV